VRWIWLLHLLLLAVGWLVALAWGTAGLVAAAAALLAVHVVVWRADLVQVAGWSRVRRLVRRDGRRRPAAPSYSALGHAVQMGAHSKREFDLGLRRRLQHVASERLAAHHGVDLHRDPAAARDLLGATVWELLDPQRPVSGRREDDGVSLHRLAEVVERLERT
jgi:hypothetical protein